MGLRIQEQEASPFYRLSDWNLQQAGLPYDKNPRLNITDTDQLKLGISTVINNDKQEALE